MIIIRITLTNYYDAQAIAGILSKNRYHVTEINTINNHPNDNTYEVVWESKEKENE